MKTAAWWLLGSLIVAGCGGGSSLGSVPLGQVCASDASCKTGLQCLSAEQYTAGKCELSARFCSVSCTLDSDCAAVGTGLICVDQCGDKASSRCFVGSRK